MVPEPELKTGDEGYHYWREGVTWYRRAYGWYLHLQQVHNVVDFHTSVLGGLARSPPAAATLALKQLICWTYDRRHEGVTFGRKGNTSLMPPPIDD